MYKPDDEKIEQAAEETGILQENDINESALEAEAPQEEVLSEPASVEE